MSHRNQIPQAIVPYHSADKRLIEEWTPGRDPANFPSPFRMLLLGPPGGGKTCVMKNIIIQQKPAFDEVYVIHEDAGDEDNAAGTSEWDDLDPTAIMGDVPALAYWNAVCAEDDPDAPPVKRLVILDDVEMKGGGAGMKTRLRNIATLLRYCSSHKGFSVMIAFQDFFGLDPIVKKVANVFLVWKPHARNEASLIDNRTGLAKGTLKTLFSEVATGPHDFITIDLSKGSPFPLRLGLWTPIELEDSE
jgi:hypothetical protein